MICGILGRCVDNHERRNYRPIRPQFLYLLFKIFFYVNLFHLH
nr:MAG TPA: hypothetical protein [Bacteriophage sp.]